MRFSDSSAWTPRGQVLIARDSANQILSIQVQNEDIFAIANTLKSQFEDACSSNNLYQLQIPDFGLLTSVPACLYTKYGFNETLTFHADSSGQLTAFAYEVVDKHYLASLEKNPKKRRLMTTMQFDQFETKVQIAPLLEGTRPLYTKNKYDAFGRE